MEILKRPCVLAADGPEGGGVVLVGGGLRLGSGSIKPVL